jgi:hypothetical protein
LPRNVRVLMLPECGINCTLCSSNALCLRSSHCARGGIELVVLVCTADRCKSSGKVGY